MRALPIEPESSQSRRQQRWNARHALPLPQRSGGRAGRLLDATKGLSARTDRAHTDRLFEPQPSTPSCDEELSTEPHSEQSTKSHRPRPGRCPTRPARRHDFNRSAMAGLAAHGRATSCQYELRITHWSFVLLITCRDQAYHPSVSFGLSTTVYTLKVPSRSSMNRLILCWREIFRLRKIGRASCRERV